MRADSGPWQSLFDVAERSTRYLDTIGSRRVAPSPEALAGLAGHIAAGRLKYRESIVDGLDNAPRALIGLLKGENFGKQLVRIA